MTTITYTVTLSNSDGTKATASSSAMDYPETPGGKLQSEAQRGIAGMERSHRAVQEFGQIRRPKPADIALRRARRANGAAADAGGK
jgi:hypothetical protein